MPDYPSGGLALREVILAEIRKLAEAGGSPPGVNAFQTQTGIGEAKWRGVYWARWSEALAEAGYSANQWQAKLDSATLLHRYAEISRARGALPTYADLQLMRRSDESVPNPKTLRHHFGGQDGLVAALRSYCTDRDDFGSLLAVLPEIIDNPDIQQSRLREGWVYLLKSGQHHKIGRSDELEARVKKISIALPEAATLVHAIRTDDPPGIEAYWHRRFADRRANGEWFKLDANDVAAFSRRKYQ